MCFSYIYNFHKAFYKDFKFIKEWFSLITNIKLKYNILDYNSYNFSKIIFTTNILFFEIIIINIE